MQNVAPSEDQREIVGQPWRRIYTTNYDDVIETCLNEDKAPYDSLGFYDTVRKKTGRTQQIVHLHGYIHHCDEENLDEKLVLTRTSYVRQQKFSKPWFDQFADDIRFADSVIFVGYSLSDTPITALVMGPAEYRDRISFVVRSTPTGRYKRQVSRYGHIKPIATSGLAEVLRGIDLSARPAMSHSAFVELNPSKDNKLLEPANTEEIRNLFILGKFRATACAASWPKAEYAVPRAEKVDEAINAFAHAKTLILHGRVGNGKSIFADILSIAFAARGYRCLRVKPDAVLNDNDLSFLKSTQRIVLFFRTLDDAVQTLRQMPDPRSDMRFIVEMSTDIANVRADNLRRELPQTMHRIDLDAYSARDRQDFHTILDKLGKPIRNFDEAFNNCVEPRDYILRLYEQNPIRTKLLKIAEPLWTNAELRRVMLTTFALKMLELDVSANFKREIVGADPAGVMESSLDQYRDNIHDLFEFSDGTVAPHSSIVSELLLNANLTPKDLLEWSLRVATIAARRKVEQLDQELMDARFHEAKNVLGRVMQVSQLRKLIGRISDRDALIKGYFEEVRRVDEINQEPLFWLQFAIALDIEHAPLADLRLALDYVNTAYARGEENPSFRSYQLDTYHLRLLLHIETHAQTDPTSRVDWDSISDQLEKFKSMVNSENHRGFVADVLAQMEDFVNARIGVLEAGQKRSLNEYLMFFASAFANKDENLRMMMTRCHERILRSLAA